MPTVAGLGDYFVGERIRVWVSAGEREAFIVPGAFVTTRFGMDYVRVAQGRSRDRCAGAARAELPRPDMPDALEILSGLKTGDGLVRP